MSGRLDTTDLLEPGDFHHPAGLQHVFVELVVVWVMAVAFGECLVGGGLLGKVADGHAASRPWARHALHACPTAPEPGNRSTSSSSGPSPIASNSQKQNA